MRYIRTINRRRTGSILAAAAGLLAAMPAPAQTVDEQIKNEQLEGLRLANDKARLAALDPLRSLPAPDAKIASSEKAAEAVLLRTRLYQGLAAKLIATAFPGKAIEPKPLLVVGAVPMTTIHWDAYAERRRALLEAIGQANDAWCHVYACPVKGSHSLSVALGVTVVATLYSLFKTDVSIAGAALPAQSGEFEGDLRQALAQRFAPPKGEARWYGVVDGDADAKALLGEFAGPRATARDHYQQEFLPLLVKAGGKAEAVGDPAQAAAGTLLKSVLDSYDALVRDLYTPSGDALTASIIRREAFVAGLLRPPSPMVFVTAQDGALTTTTRKGVFQSATKATSFTAVATATYLLIPAGAEPAKPVRGMTDATIGAVACIIADRQPRDFLVEASPPAQLGGGAAADRWVNYCPGVVAKGGKDGRN